MARMTKTPRGVCAQSMTVTVAGGMVTEARIEGGCSGNTQGLCRLVVGRRAEEAAALLEGIRCGFKPTSCPDQLAKVIRSAADAENKGEAV